MPRGGPRPLPEVLAPFFSWELKLGKTPWGTPSLEAGTVFFFFFFVPPCLSIFPGQKDIHIPASSSADTRKFCLTGYGMRLWHEAMGCGMLFLLLCVWYIVYTGLLLVTGGLIRNNPREGGYAKKECPVRGVRGDTVVCYDIFRERLLPNKSPPNVAAEGSTALFA